MTVIAFKDGVMAGDSLWVDETTHGIMLRKKIVRLPTGVLYGRAGEGDDRDMLALLKTVKRPDQLPSRSRLLDLKTDLSILLAFPNGAVWIVEATATSGLAEPAPKTHAVGSGAEIAIGAMAAGASARQAVAHTCRLHALCRGPVHTLVLGSAK